MNDAILSDTIPGDTCSPYCGRTRLGRRHAIAQLLKPLDSAELVNALAERGHENRAFK
jgi:hypothetical protein